MSSLGVNHQNTLFRFSRCPGNIRPRGCTVSPSLASFLRPPAVSRHAATVPSHRDLRCSVGLKIVRREMC